MPPQFPLLSGIIIAAILFLSSASMAGPPFLTDDPEPVDLHHWEFYVFAIGNRYGGDLSGLGPSIEGNYGIVPDVQLHYMTPFAFQSPRGQTGTLGYGDTELGAKIRFLHETDDLPQMSLYPLVELPTGNHNEGQGNGRTQVYTPVWIQKSFGPWTTYGGGGWWYNPGPANRNWWFMGWEVQRKITETLVLGAEIFHTTPSTIGGITGSSQTSLNLGAVYDLSETYHLLFSVGHSFQGPGQMEGYLGVQITFGPEEGGEKDKAKSNK